MFDLSTREGIGWMETGWRKNGRKALSAGRGGGGRRGIEAASKALFRSGGSVRGRWGGGGVRVGFRSAGLTPKGGMRKEGKIDFLDPPLFLARCAGAALPPCLSCLCP